MIVAFVCTLACVGAFVALCAVVITGTVLFVTDLIGGV